MTHRSLFIDIETRSTADLRKTGVYVYAEHPTTEILMIAWGIDDGPVTVWIPRQDSEMPIELEAAFREPSVRLIAHNVQFERILLGSEAGKRLGFPDLSDLHRWDCTAARAARMGLPRTLDGAAAALGLAAEKDRDGHALMLKMCKPRKPRKAELEALEPGAVLWHETDEQILRLAAYCAQDVIVEREIHRLLPALSADERETWELTERMNDAGVPVDVLLLGAMFHMIEAAENRVDAAISERTGGAVPRVTDHMALTRWLVSQGVDDAADTGVGKAALAAMLENTDLDPFIREVLIIRRDGGGAANKKWRAILLRLSNDGTIKGVLVYCGAAATGRWSSRGAQLHNLPLGGAVKNILAAVRAVLDGATLDEIDDLFGPPLVVASALLRPVFIAPAGCWVARGDYSQIEARVNPWLAGAGWKLDAFRRYDTGTGPDLYKVGAGGIYGVPAESIGKDDPRRQVGKVSELALGFQGGARALQAMAKGYAVKIPHVERPPDSSDWRPPQGSDEWIKDNWRAANPEIVRLWYALNDAAIACMSSTPGTFHAVAGRAGELGVGFRRNAKAMVMRLPSGQPLVYWTPRLREVATPWGFKPAVVYRAEDSQTKRWAEFVGYGGLWCENLVQATARELMAGAMRTMARRFGVTAPRLTVHDEGICMLPKSVFPTAKDAAEAVAEIMRETPAWAAGLPVAADASAADRYVKA